MNTDNLILRETDNAPLINKEDTLLSSEIDGNFINIYNDFIALSNAEDTTLIYDIDRSYVIGEYATFDGKLWLAIDDSTGVTPSFGLEWIDIFPTILAHEKNKDTILDKDGANETTVAEIRAFIDAGLTSTTNLSLSTKTATSFKIESSTGADVIIPQANKAEAGLLNATDKVKLGNLSGINSGDQTLVSLNGEDVDNKVNDFTTIDAITYPTTEAVDAYLTASIPSLVETFIDGSVELNTNKAIDFATVNDTLYPSVKAVDDQLDFKVDKVVGERLITSAESTLLGNTSGTNTGDQTISDATITTTDITTNNFTTAKHGFVPKGTNVGNYLKDDGTWSTISSGGLTYFTEAQSTASPNATVPVDSLTAVTGTTNGDFAILPKGTGAILARIPDNTGTGGNKRGQYALDLSRTAGASDAYIAAGNYDIILGGTRNQSNTGTFSFIANGDNNSCTGQYGTILNGNNNSVTGARGIVLNGWYSQANGVNALAGAGLYNYANGSNSVALCNGTTAAGNGAMSIGVGTNASGTNSFAGGNGSTADAINGFAIGDLASTNGVRNKFVIGGGGYSVGCTQASIAQLDGRTTGTTPTVLLANTANAGGILASTQFTLPNNSLMRVKGSIQGKQSGSTNIGVWDFDAVLVRGTTASTMTVTISNVNVVTNASAWGTPTITANTSLGCLTVTVTGIAATNIQWACRIDSTETLYA